MKNYFVKTDRGEVIQQWENPVDCNIFKDFTELTEEQSTFYSNNPNVSISEIRNCALNVIDLEEYKLQKIEELHNLSLSTGEAKLPYWKVKNAELGVYDETSNTEIKARYISIAKTCIDEYDRVALLISYATTPEEVDEAFNSNNYSNILL